MLYLVRFPGGYYVTENSRTTFPLEATRFKLKDALSLVNSTKHGEIEKYKNPNTLSHANSSRTDSYPER